MPQIESNLEPTSWRDELNRAFAVTGEGWGPSRALARLQHPQDAPDQVLAAAAAPTQIPSLFTSRHFFARAALGRGEGRRRHGS